MVCAAGHAPLERRQRVHTHDHEEHADERAGIKPRADGKAETRARPESGGGGQALDLLAAGNENGSCAQKADAVDDLCAETRNVGFYADLCANIRPRPCHHGKFVQAEQHSQRRAETDEHIGAETGRTALASALQTDAAAEQHSQSEPQHDRCKMKFAKICNRFCHVLLLLISCGNRYAHVCADGRFTHRTPWYIYSITPNQAKFHPSHCKKYFVYFCVICTFANVCVFNCLNIIIY